MVRRGGWRSKERVWGIHTWARLRQDGYDGQSGGLSVGAGTTEESGPSGAAFSGSPSCKKQGKSFWFLSFFVLPDPPSPIWTYHSKAVLYFIFFLAFFIFIFSVYLY